MNSKAELVLDSQALLGEGPIWDDRRQLLFWVDILAGKLHAFDPARNENQAFDIGQDVGTVVLTESGPKVMLAVYKGFAAYDLETEELSLVVHPEAHLPGNRFNDGKCDPNGRFWAGTMAYSDQKDQGSLYSLDSDLSVHKALDGIAISNGLAWSLDGSLMYYIDSPTHSVATFDFDLDMGAISNRRVTIQVPEEMGTPDGMTIDEQGMLWIALWDGGLVCRWDPENGDLLQTIDLPVSRPTACAFGGRELDTLYITSARTGLTEELLKEQPHAGGLFAIRPGFCGIPTFRFAGQI